MLPTRKAGGVVDSPEDGGAAVIARAGRGFLHDTEDRNGVVAVDGEEWEMEFASEAADGGPGDGRECGAGGFAQSAALGCIVADE
jgi:hypothetical protein